MTHAAAMLAFTSACRRLGCGSLSTISRAAVLAWLGFLLLATSCATVAKIFPATRTPFPPGSLVLGEVWQVASRAEIVEHRLDEHLVGLGIPESDIRDGSVAVAGTQCCGGPEMENSVFMFYVPPRTVVEVGDIVEVRVGGEGEPSTAVDIRQRRTSSDETCGWIPPDPYNLFWEKVLYCDGIERMGWVQYGPEMGTGERNWIKLPPSDAQSTTLASGGNVQCEEATWTNPKTEEAVPVRRCALSEEEQRQGQE